MGKICEEICVLHECSPEWLLQRNISIIKWLGWPILWTSVSLSLSNLRHLSVCRCTKWPCSREGRFARAQQCGLPFSKADLLWHLWMPTCSHRGRHWCGVLSPGDQPALWGQGSYVRPLPSGFGFAFPACSVSAQTTFHEPAKCFTPHHRSFIEHCFWSLHLQQKFAVMDPRSPVLHIC